MAGPGDHLFIERPDRVLDFLGFQLGKQGMDMSGPLFDGSILADSEGGVVFFGKPLVVVEALAEFRCQADDIPVVGQLLGPQGIESNRAAAELVDGHRGGGGGEIDQDIDPVGVPALSQQPAGSDQASRDPFLEHRGDQADVEPWSPFAALAGDLHEVAVPGGEFQLDIGIFSDQPLVGLLQEELGEVVVDEDCRAGHENRVEQVGVGVGEQQAKGLDGSAGFLVENVSDFLADRRGLFVVGDHDGTDRITQDLEFGIENRDGGLGLGLRVGHDAAGR